jgi:DNA polymerase-1
VSERLFLLDATLLFFRALYGVPDVFVDDTGRSINGVRGYLGYLTGLLRGRDGNPPVRHCVAAFDESLTSCWRNRLYAAYKANRPPAEAGILHQLTLCRRLTAELGVPVLADLEYEADDYIATLARTSRMPVTIVSRDKDLKQLLDHRVSLVDPKDGSLATPETFAREFGFSPAAFPDYQALTGDSVDNIPGVPGVGPKSARRLIETFGDLERIYDGKADWAAAGIKASSKMAARLEASREDAFLYRRILRLDDQVPIPAGFSSGPLTRPARSTVMAALDGLGVRTGLGSALTTAMEDHGV